MPHITIEKSKKLSNEQKKIARVQDSVISVIFGKKGIPDATLVGGLVAWRCTVDGEFSGSNRFTGDIDIRSIYPNIKEDLAGSLVEHGLEFTRYKDTGNLIYSRIVSGSGACVELEIMKMQTNGRMTDYTCANGLVVPVVAIPLDMMAHEKMAAYSNRREYRDLYDLSIIIKAIARDGRIGIALKEKLEGFIETMPEAINEEKAKKLIYEGRAPSAEELRIMLRSAAKKG